MHFGLRHRAAMAFLAIAVLGALAQTRAAVPVLSLVDLGIHELGHFLTFPMPDLITAAMGSFTQIAVPVTLAVYFGVKRQERPSAALMVAWAGASARNVAVYMADAPFERLVLIGGDHDWAFIFHHFDALSWAPRVAGLVAFLGSLTILGALGWAAYLVWIDVAAVRVPGDLRSSDRSFK